MFDDVIKMEFGKGLLNSIYLFHKMQPIRISKGKKVP